MKKKTKKNLHVDTPTVSFKDYVNGSKEFEFIKMAKNGAKTLPFFKETWDFIERNLENDDRYINVFIPFMSYNLHLAMLEDDKKLREKYIWSIWYYLKLDEPLLICHFQKESEQLILEADQQIHQILEGDYSEFLELQKEEKYNNTVIK